MLLKQNLKWNCEKCFKPVGRRLALFGDNDEYECYAEGYIKGFWGLCDRSTSVDTFQSKSDGKVITKQPTRNEIHFKTASVLNNIKIKKLKVATE